MKKLFTLSFLVLFALNIIAQQKPEFVPGNIIVQIPDGQVNDVVAENQFLNGTPTNLKLSRLLSAPMAAYLLEFDESVHHEKLLQQVWDHKSVTVVQFNHYIQDRNTTPNDPQFDDQWWHVNTGAGSATADADIDSDEAWEITTGGVTALGDTIVVCVVDDGGDLDHPDLMDNNWINHNEIPDNNIDDDGNGYVDDYLGWDPTTDNDNIDGGSHGVSVAGMIGAVGDNGVGVSGVNWNVKIMNMGYGNINQEANVIEAYTYPLVMRRLYEETNGDRGAFVVATNSSWGINYGDPADAPLWCAFYDTLGAAGILSAGATANLNINIDTQGDLPTGCSSDYMISVTATNNQDVRTFSGYGATTVDLGAPGEDVRTTAGGGGYTTTDGTSFATPATAGAIALLYSAPCVSLANIAHADPQLAAEIVRDAIFNGVDPISNLSNECVTGGRLNLKGALDEILNTCSNGGCQPPFSVNATGVTDELADISFAHLPDVDTFNLFYGITGQPGTLVSDLESGPYQLTGLTPCVEYWVSMQSVCDGLESAWTDSVFFNTDGCCEPPFELTLSAPTDSSIAVAWSTVLAANSYELQWKENGASNWNTVAPSILGESYVLSDLEPCTEYDIRVATICATQTTNYTAFTTMRTTGCGACTDLVYCGSSGDTDFEWIGDIEVAGLANSTGFSPSGYEDFTDMSVDLQRGETYNVRLTPDFDGQNFREHFRIWIDLDQNGDFNSPTDLRFDDDQGSTSTVTGTISIPLTAELGSTRMRISMAYGSNFGGDYPQTSCEIGFEGEVEDYCVNILEEEPVVNPGIEEQNGLFGMNIYPVPATEVLSVELDDPNTANVNLQLLDLTGRIISQQAAIGKRTTLDVSALTEGTYIIQAVNANEVIGRARMLKE